MKPPRSVLALIIMAGLAGLGLGVRAAWRERTRPARELAALEATLAAARQVLARPLPELDALAERAHEDVLPEDALARLPDLEAVAIVSLDKTGPLVVARRGPGDFEALARALRGEPALGELAALSIPDPPERFERIWPRGVAGGVARVTVVFGRRRGGRVVLGLQTFARAVEGD